MTDPEDLSIEELEKLLERKKKQQEAEWEQERQDWRKSQAPQAKKYGFKIVDEDQKTAPKRTRAKLTDKDRAAIKKARAEGQKAADIARKYGCSVQAVYSITKDPK